MAIIIMMIPIIIFMSDSGTYWGLIGIVGVIAGLGIPYLIIHWKRTSKFQDVTGFLTRLTLMQIDEKIAIMDEYIIKASTWDDATMNQQTDRIVSDIRAISRIRNDILDDQRIMLRERLIRLKNILTDKHHDTAKIEAVMGLLD